jgi:hypothetical protein
VLDEVKEAFVVRESAWKSSGGEHIFLIVKELAPAKGFVRGIFGPTKTHEPHYAVGGSI